MQQPVHDSDGDKKKLTSTSFFYVSYLQARSVCSRAGMYSTRGKRVHHRDDHPMQTGCGHHHAAQHIQGDASTHSVQWSKAMHGQGNGEPNRETTPTKDQPFPSATRSSGHGGCSRSRATTLSRQAFSVKVVLSGQESIAGQPNLCTGFCRIESQN